MNDTSKPIALVIVNVGGNVSFPIRETTSRVFRKDWEMACLAGFLTGREAAKHMVASRPAAAPRPVAARHPDAVRTGGQDRLAVAPAAA